MVKVPPFLKAGDTIALISTARHIPEDVMLYSVNLFENLGFKVQVGPNALKKYNQFAGTDSERASDLQWAIDNPEIKAIISSRGGYGTAKIIDRIDWTGFKRDPKWIVGFSDLTALHWFLNLELNIASIHGTMPVNLDPESGFFHEDNLSSLIGLLKGRWENFVLPDRVPDPGHAKIHGKLIGGNLSVIYSMLGSVSWSGEDMFILMLEDLDEYLYHVDRMMLNLTRNGLLEQVSGILLGGFTKMHDNAIPFGKDAMEIISEFAAPYTIPIWSGLDIGHVSRNLALPLGVDAFIENGNLLFKSNNV